MLLLHPCCFPKTRRLTGPLSWTWPQIIAACHCGKLRRPVRCSQSQFTCGKLCGRRLPCGHRCPHKCHAGNCPACSLSAAFSCHCGAETKTLPCSQSDFQCERVCGRGLPCGRHRCERVCHEGACGGCPMEGPRLCPCGKVSHGCKPPNAMLSALCQASDIPSRSTANDVNTHVSVLSDTKTY